MDPAQLLESVLVVSSLAYAAVLMASLAYRDGRIWSVWRWNAAFGFAGTLLGVFLIHRLGGKAQLSLGIAMLCVLISIVRAAHAVTNLILAYHLHKLVQPRKTGGLL